MNKLLYLLLIAVCWSCSQDSETEKHQSKRDQVVDVRDKMKEFSTQDVLIGRISRTYLIDNYLIVTDYNSPDKLIHLFDKNTFEHLASSTYQGQGPDEITIIGHVGIDETNRRFFVSDHGKLKIFAYDLDSVLTTPEYQPSVKIDMKKKLFPDDYLYLNDTLCIAKIIEPIGNNDYGNRGNKSYAIRISRFEKSPLHIRCIRRAPIICPVLYSIRPDDHL